jgi:hypothetical protein
MADQDFKINIVTLADLTGIKLTQQQLNALQTAAAAGNKQAIDALKKLSTAQKEAESAAKAQETALIHGTRAAAAYGLIIGGSVAAAINQFADEQNKVTKELEKQGEQLVTNIQEWSKLSEAATSMDQLATAAQKPVEAIGALKQKFNEANNESLSLKETVEDLIVKFVTWTPFSPGPNKALHDELTRGLGQDLALAQENAARNIKRGLDEQRDAHEDIDKVIAREQSHLQQQQALLRNLDPKTQLQSWVAVEQTIERIQKKLETLNAQREKQLKEKEPVTKPDLLRNQEQQLQALLNSGRLTPVEQETVSQQLTKTREERFQGDIAFRETSFQKGISDRDKRFTTPPTAPPEGEKTSETNTELIKALNTLIGLWR